jgi:hypothetical protein
MGTKERGNKDRGWTNVDVNLTISSDGDVDPLGVLRGITRGMSKLDRALRDAVIAARGRGNSWEEIGEALGVSRQSAWERFKDDEPSRSDVIDRVMGSLKGRVEMSSDEMRELAREEEEEIELRKWGSLPPGLKWRS